MTTKRPFSLAIMAGPATARIVATCPSGTWVPLGDATRTLLSASGVLRNRDAYRTRTGNRCRPSMVRVRLVSPTAVSITSWMAPTEMP